MAPGARNERGTAVEDANVFARFVVESYTKGDTSEFPRAFETTERILRDGDDDARTAARVGVLESMRRWSSHKSFGAAPFALWLGPLSREIWREIDEAKAARRRWWWR